MNNPPSLLDLDRQLCFALYSASLAMTKAYKPMLAELGVTYPQYLVLLVLWQHGAQHVGEIGDRLGLDSGTLTPLAKRLQTLGLIERQRSAVDERQVQISLTAAGKHLRARAEPIPICVLELTGCQLPQLESLTRELQDLRNQLVAANPAAATNSSQPAQPSQPKR